MTIWLITMLPSFLNLNVVDLTSVVFLSRYHHSAFNIIFSATFTLVILLGEYSPLDDLYSITSWLMLLVEEIRKC
ncbi:hypothetical protein RchiOBHm_Chr7g0198191 [Rosa chinensis]|uniref:Uncharacterized protein n=1 Tax=Rosa chinensis TaxID=74649 RepID=A0A2P6P755_ROSCH|nr:hypothetical protein RchiOBHm_Chr7g0198191 [Rosa chinensis]